MKAKEKLIEMYEDELNKSLHHEIQTNFKWYGESKEQEIRDSNKLKLENFKKTLDKI